jgi:hypothetical protein
MDMEHKPPSKVLAFFRWYCNPDFREEIEGDLIERFQCYSKEFGHKRANWLFIKEVLLLFRPTIIGNIHLANKKSIIMTTQSKRLLFILAAVPNPSSYPVYCNAI